MKLSSKAHYGLNACCVLAGMYPEKASAGNWRKRSAFRANIWSR